MLEFIMLTPIAGSVRFFVFARANILYLFFYFFVLLSLVLPFLIQFIFGFIRIYAHGIHFRLRFLTFRAAKAHFFPAHSFFLCFFAEFLARFNEN